MSVIIDQAAVEELIHGPGPVHDYVELTAHAILEVAKSFVHTSSEEHKDGSPHLADSGHVIPEGRGGAAVVFDAPHAASIELGARPHVIAARNAPRLVFFWPKAGKVVAFKQVNHPGNEAQHYLLRAAETVVSAPLA